MKSQELVPPIKATIPTIATSIILLQISTTHTHNCQKLSNSEQKRLLAIHIIRTSSHPQLIPVSRAPLQIKHRACVRVLSLRPLSFRMQINSLYTHPYATYTSIYITILSIALYIRVSQHNNTARLMLKYMDRTADPCQDFYQYACGNWERYNRIPKDKAGYDTFETLRESLDWVLKQLLEEPPRDGVDTYADSAVLKAKNHFRSCMNHGESRVLEK